MAKNLSQGEWQRRVDLLIERRPLTPGRGKVIVARDPRAERMGPEGLLHTPEEAKDESQTGTIVALGEPRENPMGSPVDFVFGLGDRVIINQLAGKKLRWYDLEMAVLDEEEILVRMNDPAKERAL